MTDQTTHTTASTTYAVDAEHGALRLGVVIVFIVVLIFSYIFLNVLIPNDGLNILALIGSFVFTAVFTQQIERVMRQRWPSGRTVSISHNHIQLKKDKGAQHSIDPARQVNVLLWRFKISRRSRIPKGWFMVACALEQDDTYLSVYTFFSPEQCDQLRLENRFTLLTGKKDREGHTDLRLAGEQRRLHIAEQARWLEGAEMNQDDFQSYIRQLQEQFPQWMPSALS
jgi:hypothetical protein